MEQDTSVSSMGSINLDAKPKKSILKRSEPEAAESADGDGGEEGSAEAGKRHVPFSHIIPELSRLEAEDARLGSAAADRGTSDLQSVSSAASLSPLSSDEQLDDAEATAERKPRSGPAYSGYVPPYRSDGSRDPGHQRRRTSSRRRGGRGRLRGPQAMSDMEPLSPPRGSFSPLALGSLSPRLRSAENRSPSPLRLVRYSPSPERAVRGRHSRSPMRRSPGRRSPVRRSRSRRSRSRSPRRRSRSPGRHRRGHSPRYGRSPGRRGWSRSPSPRRRRSRSRSRSPPWGRNVERSLLAMSRSQGAPPTGYGPPPPGMPGYPPMTYPAPGPPPPHPGYMPQPMPYANPPRPPMPMPMQMVPGANPPFGQPMYAPSGAPMYPQQMQPQPQPTPPGVSVAAPGLGGVSERIDSDTFLREVERRKQQKGSQQPQRQLTNVPQQGQITPPTTTAAAAAAPADVPKPQKLPSENTELLELQKKKPWMTQELLDLKAEMEKAKEDKNKKHFKCLAKQWYHLVYESKQKLGLVQMHDVVRQMQEGGQVVTLSAETLARLTSQQVEYVKRRDRLAGELHQLKLEQKELNSNNVIMRKGKPTCNKELHNNLKRQGALLTALESVSSVVAQLKHILDPSVEGSINGVGAALLKAANGEAEEAADTTSKSEVAYLLLGDETLSAVQVYIREQESRASFGTSLPAERIRLVSRPDAALSSVEFRHWVRAAVRQSATGTLVLLASAGCLEAETGAWSAAAAVAPLLPLLRDLRADGLTRVVVVGVPLKPEAGSKDRGVQFNRALQDQLESAGPHVPRVTYTPIRGGPQDGFGEQTEGGLTLDLYHTLLDIISKCEQKPTIPGVPEPGDPQQKQLDSVEDASETLQGLLDGLRGRLAGDEAAGLGAVAALLEKMKGQADGMEQLLMKKQEQDLNAEDPAVFFRDPADHVCLHCKKIFLNAKAYLEHLKSPEHMKQYLTSQQNVPESPWRRDIPPIEKKEKNAESKSIKGLDMFIRVDCWYCKVCEMFVGDLRCASSHLKSRRHNAKYDEYLESNPSYHAVVGETRSRLLLECAAREEERTRQRRREEAQKRGDRMNERMRRQSEGGVQDVTDEAGAAGAGAAGPSTPVTPPTVGGKKAGIKLNLLASPSQPPEELGQLKRKVQANIAAEQEAKRLKEETAEKEAKEAAEIEKKEAKKKEEKVKKEEEERKKSIEESVPTVSNQPGASAAAATKVKITLADKAPQKSAASGAAAKKKPMPIVGKLPKLRQKKPEPTKPEKPAAEQPTDQQLSKSEKATLELANRQEVLATIPTPADPPPGTTAAPGPAAAVPEPQTEAISDDEAPGDIGAPADMQDLLDIDLPDADDERRADAEELKMLGICDEDVAAQQLPATRPPP